MRIAAAAVFAIPLGLASGCATLHHVEIGEMEASQDDKRFEFKLSATGLDLEQAAQLVKATSNSSAVKSGADTVSTVWQMFTFGPKTGEVTFSDTYADQTFSLLSAACPRGRLVSFVTIRETAKYPVVSGEIVRVFGYCRKGD